MRSTKGDHGLVGNGTTPAAAAAAAELGTWTPGCKIDPNRPGNRLLWNSCAPIIQHIRLFKTYTKMRTQLTFNHLQVLIKNFLIIPLTTEVELLIGEFFKQKLVREKTEGVGRMKMLDKRSFSR